MFLIIFLLVFLIFLLSYAIKSLLKQEKNKNIESNFVAIQSSDRGIAMKKVIKYLNDNNVSICFLK